MGILNIHAAKTHLSRLLEEVGAGEEIVIAKAGRPVARLVPIEKPSKRKLGLLAGKLTIPASFDDPLPDDVIASFEGR